MGAPLQSVAPPAQERLCDSLHPSLTARATSASGTTSTRRHTRRIMESSPEPDSDDALLKRTYQELLEAFRQRHCISINLTDGTKLDNGFTEFIDYAITQHYPTLEYLLTTGRTTFVEDTIRKYEHVIQRTIQNIETHDFWKIHCNNTLILDRNVANAAAKDKQMLKLALQRQRELRLAITIDVSTVHLCSYKFIYFLIFCQLCASP